jgi:hypothetical protein
MVPRGGRMTYFDADMELKDLGSDEWQLYSMNGAGLAAHNITEAAKKALKLMVEYVAGGDGVLTASKKAYRHVYKVLVKYENFGACDTEPRGILCSIIDEYARRRFEADVDVYWEV